MFFLPTSNKFPMQNDPLMQLRLIFHKAFNKSNWKCENLKVIGLVVFQQLRNCNCRGRGEGEVRFVSIIILVYTHKFSPKIKFP